ncbi:MAG: SPOR domain-containing protein [Desulfobacterales bacterium]|nr:SPOR domain-containing protein [Desulfobacterales bacterium]
MLRLIRHISVRFWLVVLAALPLSFWALPALTLWFPGVPAAAITGGIFILVGTGFGLTLDFLGRHRIRGLIREGQLWERAGITKRAEQKYIRAIRIFDSVWISPWAGRRLKPFMTEALARFYLTCGSDHPGFGLAAAVYLKGNPQDETLAALWLERLKEKGKADAIAHSVLTALADAHHKTPRICLKLIGPFLDLRRVDFSAKRLYRSFLDIPELMPSENGGLRDKYATRIQELMGPEAEGDTPIIAEGPSRGGTLGDRRAGNESAGADISIDGEGGRSREYLSQLGRLPVRSMRILVPAAKGGASAGVTFFSALLGGCAGLLKKSAAGLRDLLRHLIRDRERTGKYVKSLLMGMLGVWLVFFVWSTLSHMLGTSTPEQPSTKIDIRINKPFTIQVAAYLKQSHADRYLAALAEKGITATVKKTGGGGKTWYLVRISEFPDKKSAADYGNRLKAEKIIDDFFVSNK